MTTPRERELENQVARMQNELDKLRRRNGELFVALEEEAPSRLEGGQVLPRESK